MKRSGPPKRKKPLRRTRGDKPMSRGEIRRVPKGPVKRHHDRNPNATGWTQRVFTLYGRRCACGQAAVQAHHVIPRQTITNDGRKTREERDALEYDARNGLPVCQRCHERHESGAARIAAGVLRAAHIEWALDFNYDHVLRKIYGWRP